MRLTPRKLPVALALVIGCAKAETASEAPLGPITPIDAPSGPQSGEPNLAVDASGGVYLSWLERGADSTVALKLAVRDDGQWSTPVTVTSRKPAPTTPR